MSWEREQEEVEEMHDSGCDQGHAKIHNGT